jgi:glycosyltransferase 2 family protein
VSEGASSARPWSRRRRLRLAVALTASILALALAFRGSDLARVAATVSSVRFEYLLLAVPVDLAVFLAKALKWRLVLLPVRRTPLVPLYSAIAVGALAGNVLPFRLDELARAFYLGRREGLSRSAVLGTILVERFVDLAMLLVALTVLVIAFGARSGLLGFAVSLAAALVAAALLLIGLPAGRPWLAAQAARIAPTWFAARGQGALDGLVQGLSAFPRGGRLVAVLACALAEWVLTVRYMTLVLLAFSVHVPLPGVLLLVAAGYLSFAIPSGPAGLGVFELLAKGSLVGGARIEPNLALGMALVLHVLLVAPISLVGAACLVREGLSLSALRRLDVPAVPEATQGS